MNQWTEHLAEQKNHTGHNIPGLRKNRGKRANGAMRDSDVIGLF
jgi:hypothetical protein